MRHHAVEHAPAPRVGVVSPVDEVPDAASGLRTPPRNCLVDGPGEGVREAACVRIVVSKETHEIAHHRVADAVGPGVAGGVDQLVDPTGLEAVEDVDVRIRIDERGLGPLRIEPDSALGACERPAVVRDRFAGIPGIAASRQSRLRVVERDGGVASRGCPAAQGEGRDPGPVGDELGSHKAGEGRGTVVRHRHVEQHAPVARQQVSFPCRPRHRVAAPHEEAVAGVAQGPRIVRRRRIVEELELTLVAAVAVSEEEAAVARSHRLEDADIGGVLDEAARIARRLVEIHDVRVCACIRIDGEVRAPDEPFVGTGVLEGMAMRERLAPGDPQLQRAVHDTPPSFRPQATGADYSCPSRRHTSSNAHDRQPLAAGSQTALGRMSTRVMRLQEVTSRASYGRIAQRLHCGLHQSCPGERAPRPTWRRMP